jgi:hypothetical protein
MIAMEYQKQNFCFRLKQYNLFFLFGVVYLIVWYGEREREHAMLLPIVYNRGG